MTLRDNLFRIILIAGAVVITAMLLFPPWRYVVAVGTRTSEAPAGYGFITRPPDPEGMPDTYVGRAISVKMDDQRLIAQMIGVVIVCGLLVLAVRKKSAT
jgi:hypothetical protein